MRKARALPPNVLLEQLEPTVERRYCLMGEALLFETNDPSLLNVAASIFDHFAGSCDPEGARAPLRLRLLVHDPEETAVAPLRPVYRTQGHLLSIVLTPYDTAVVDLAQGYAFAVITPAVARDPVRVRTQFIATLALAMLGPARKFFPLHAACVVKDGMALMLAGPSGVGKSTLTMACARSGYQVLSDDVVHVAGGAEPVRLWGMPWRFQLLPDSVRFFPELSGLVPRVQGNGEAKLEVDLGAMLQGSTLAWAEPGPLLLLERGRGRPSIERLSADEVQARRRDGRLDTVWPWQVGWTQELEDAFERLLAGGVYRFEMVGTPDAAVRTLDEFCERIGGGHDGS